MSSGIAAPSGGRFIRARTLGYEGAREQERRRLRRHLRVTTLRALEDIAAAGPEIDAGSLIHMADDAATELRALALSLAGGHRRPAIAELRGEIGAMLHDTTLQALQYLAADGYGAELSADRVRRIAAEAAAELRGELLRLGALRPCELVAGLQHVVAAARLRGTAEIEFATSLERRIYGAEAAALVAAAREALNNVCKHAQASKVTVLCDTTAAGTRVVVRDNGIGVDLPTARAGIGLRHSIIERMAAHGGRADIQSAPGQGTLVTLTTGAFQEVAA